MSARTALFGLVRASLFAAAPRGAGLPRAWWVAEPAALVLSLWLILVTGAGCARILSQGVVPSACARTQRWTTLDARWRRLRKAVERGLDAPAPLAVSAAAVALGHLAAWPLGWERARAPFDELWRELAAAHYAERGRVRGREPLVAVTRAPRAGEPADVRGLACPAWVAYDSRLFVRVWRSSPLDGAARPLLAAESRSPSVGSDDHLPPFLGQKTGASRALRRLRHEGFVPGGHAARRHGRAGDA